MKGTFLYSKWDGFGEIPLRAELDLVGDEGTTEIRGATRRQGVEVAARGKVWGPLYVNGSFTWTHAEFRTGEAIPLAPEYIAYGAAILKWPEGLTSQLQATYMGVRPLLEDHSIKVSRLPRGSRLICPSGISFRCGFLMAGWRCFCTSKICSTRSGYPAPLEIEATSRTRSGHGPRRWRWQEKQQNRALWRRQPGCMG